MIEQFIAVLPQLVISLGTAAATIAGVIKVSGSKAAAMDRIIKTMDGLSLDINRLILHDEHLSLEERLAAGERYVQGGGNGPAGAYYEKLLNEYKGELRL
jgi:hypothetical protein